MIGPNHEAFSPGQSVVSVCQDEIFTSDASIFQSPEILKARIHLRSTTHDGGITESSWRSGYKATALFCLIYMK